MRSARSENRPLISAVYSYKIGLILLPKGPPCRRVRLRLRAVVSPQPSRRRPGGRMSRVGSPRGEQKRPFCKTNQRRMKPSKINALCADVQPRPCGRRLPPVWRNEPPLFTSANSVPCGGVGKGAKHLAMGPSSPGSSPSKTGVNALMSRRPRLGGRDKPGRACV
jgi:hypothetical protein